MLEFIYLFFIYIFLNEFHLDLIIYLISIFFTIIYNFNFQIVQELDYKLEVNDRVLYF